MPTLTLSQWGNSLALRVPKAVAEAHNWKAGDLFSFTDTEHGFLIRKICRIKKYDLADILKGVSDMPKEDIVGWGPPTGKENW